MVLIMPHSEEMPYQMSVVVAVLLEEFRVRASERRCKFRQHNFSAAIDILILLALINGRFSNLLPLVPSLVPPSADVVNGKSEHDKWNGDEESDGNCLCPQPLGSISSNIRYHMTANSQTYFDT